MYWQNPTILFGLWILPVVAALLVYGQRKRAAAARHFADPAMVARLMPPLGGPRPWLKGILLLAGLALLIIAAARPRFGVYFEKVSQRGVDLFVALDVSRSMDAQDVAPSRLERAKSDIRDLLTRLAGDRVGLIVFAGKPVVKVPLTTDQGFFRMVLDEIDTHSAPRGGTLIGDAIRKAMEAMPKVRDRDEVIVLITDGEDHDSFAEEAAKQAAAAGVKIFAVGLGDAKEGARIPVHDAGGGQHFLKNNGQVVWSKVNERLLKQIALTTGGAYIPAGTRAYDLGQIYADHLAGLAQGAIQEEKRKRYREQFQLFVCLGMVLLLLEMAIPSYGRSADNRSVPSGRHTTAVAASLAMLSLAVHPGPLLAASPAAPESVARGIRCFQAGHYKQAITAFRTADVARPDDPRIAFDLATAYAVTGDHEKAEPLFQQAALARDPSLAVRSRYNLGTLAAARARALFGKKPEAATAETRTKGLALLAEAVGHYRDCLDLDPNHADARHNLEVIRLWIKRMQALWAERDRKKNRAEMNLLEFLAMIEAKQRDLRTTIRALENQPDSPRRRQAISTAASRQRQLEKEIEPLKKKITESLQPPKPPGGSSTKPKPLDATRQKAAKLLAKLADAAGTAMVAAAGALDQHSVAKAVPKQAEAVEQLDQIYMGVAPFPSIVQRALTTQQTLTDQVATAAKRSGTPSGSKKNMNEVPHATNKHAEDAFGDEAKAPDSRKIDLDGAQIAWNQQFVAGWARVLKPKAEQGLKQLEPADRKAPAGPAVSPGQPGPAGTAANKQLDGLKRSMQKAIQLAPDVERLAADAAKALLEKKTTVALPSQQKALKLLKEIAKPLPKQQQGQQQGQQPKSNSGKNQPEKQQPRPQPHKKQQRDLSRRQAEAVLRKVRERQRKRRDMQRQLQQSLAQPEGVDKDW